MLRSRVSRCLVLVATLALLVPALGTARHVRVQDCTIDYCPSAGEIFECCDWMGPDCPCQTCPDFC